MSGKLANLVWQKRISCSLKGSDASCLTGDPSSSDQNQDTSRWVLFTKHRNCKKQWYKSMDSINEKLRSKYLCMLFVQEEAPETEESRSGSSGDLLGDPPLFKWHLNTTQRVLRISSAGFLLNHWITIIDSGNSIFTPLPLKSAHFENCSHEF